MTELDQYQKETRRTAATSDVGLHATREGRLAVFGLGVAGEAGEVADLIKKHVGHGKGLNRFDMIKELGDVLWYVAAIADQLGVPLSEVAATNIAKLRVRFKDKFTAEEANALTRADERPSVVVGVDANGSPTHE